MDQRTESRGLRHWRVVSFPRWILVGVFGTLLSSLLSSLSATIRWPGLQWVRYCQWSVLRHVHELEQNHRDRIKRLEDQLFDTEHHNKELQSSLDIANMELEKMGEVAERDRYRVDAEKRQFQAVIADLEGRTGGGMGGG